MTGHDLTTKPDVDTLVAKQTAAPAKWSRLALRATRRCDIQTVDDADGSVQVSFGLGQPLVIGQKAYAVGIANAPVTGLAQIVSGMTNATAQVTGRRLAGLVQTRDVLLPDYQAKLDALAYEVVQQVNTLHDAGFTLAGVDAPPVDQALGSAAGAASRTCGTRMC